MFFRQTFPGRKDSEFSKNSNFDESRRAGRADASDRSRGARRAHRAAGEIVLGCRGKVAVTGMGKSGLIGQKISATLASTGTPSYFLHPAEGVHGDLGMVTKDDVIVALSYSGETDEVVRILPVFARLGTPLIAITGTGNSTLWRAAQAVLNIHVKEEACPIQLAPTASSTAALAMGDALAMAVLEARGFQPEDFARFHPGGALGKKLIRVKELMVTGDDVPQVEEAASLDRVVREMSARRLGMTCVMGMDQELRGVITDGDLRRALEKTEDLPKLTAGDLMTIDPKTIDQDEMAAAAVQLMEAGAITSLAVTAGADKLLAGVLHLHHVLRAGVV
ncbi:MAG: KpsF/GutQ family sugar-phosphate isomerase [Nitrospinae bacterium]|nr:KpsF/GutQ family sugar-phosphate isomerase [Nitrospinota bacterium]